MSLFTKLCEVLDLWMLCCELYEYIVIDLNRFPQKATSLGVEFDGVRPYMYMIRISRGKLAQP